MALSSTNIFRSKISISLGLKFAVHEMTHVFLFRSLVNSNASLFVPVNIKNKSSMSLLYMVIVDEFLCSTIINSSSNAHEEICICQGHSSFHGCPLSLMVDFIIITEIIICEDVSKTHFLVFWYIQVQFYVFLYCL